MREVAGDRRKLGWLEESVAERCERILSDPDVLRLNEMADERERSTPDVASISTGGSERIFEGKPTSRGGKKRGQ